MTFKCPYCRQENTNVAVAKIYDLEKVCPICNIKKNNISVTTCGHLLCSECVENIINRQIEVMSVDSSHVNSSNISNTSSNIQNQNLQNTLIRQNQIANNFDGYTLSLKSSSLCINYLFGNCYYGDRCIFTHGIFNFEVYSTVSIRTYIKDYMVIKYKKLLNQHIDWLLLKYNHNTEFEEKLMCSRYLSSTCTNTNCNFAHGIVEIRPSNLRNEDIIHFKEKIINQFLEIMMIHINQVLLIRGRYVNF